MIRVDKEFWARYWDWTSLEQQTPGKFQEMSWNEPAMFTDN